MGFANHDLPAVKASDNSSHFVNEIFSEFVEKNFIKHISYHLLNYGLTEKTIYMFKNGMKVFSKYTINIILTRFL